DIGELLRILERTAVSVVIFSGKFADSPWCLDEVYTIAQSIKKYGQRALPVFYQVDWTTVAAEYHCSDDWKSAFFILSEKDGTISLISLRRRSICSILTTSISLTFEPN
ncbi:Disease resistance protein RLM3, partial [Linum grandiflorum]